MDSPDVGGNMREHRLLFIQHRMKGAGSLNGQFAGLPLMFNTLRYFLTRTGVLATGSFDVGGFIRTRPELDRPDAQIMMAPYSLDFTSRTFAFESLRDAGVRVRAQARELRDRHGALPGS